jgi:hypothetical protein
MLRVTRPSVSVAAHTLQGTGLIRHRRGSIEVLNRQGLKEGFLRVLRRRPPGIRAADGGPPTGTSKTGGAGSSAW